MSSIRVSVSGSRGHTLETYPDRTTFTTPSKGDDEVRCQLSQIGTAKIVLPRNARIEKCLGGDNPSEYLVLVLPAPASLTVFGIKEEGDASWPHVELDARKQQPHQAFTESLKPSGEEPFVVASLFSDTED